jgi:23S rRNA (uracil1939-C5)-methyltransferase
MARAKRGETLSITVDDLAFGGEGVGRIEGYVVFVPGGVPGDRVRVRLTEARARFGRGVIEAVETPSPHRVDPPCPYFGRCGGCRLQHIAYAAQLDFKAKQVADCLERLGGLDAVPLRPIVAAPEVYGYRNKMESRSPGRRPVRGGTPRGGPLRRDPDVERCPPVRWDEPSRQVRAFVRERAGASTGRSPRRGSCAS